MVGHGGLKIAKDISVKLVEYVANMCTSGAMFGLVINEKLRVGVEHLVTLPNIFRHRVFKID
jgi:hypothetical protein